MRRSIIAISLGAAIVFAAACSSDGSSKTQPTAPVAPTSTTSAPQRTGGPPGNTTPPVAVPTAADLDAVRLRLQTVVSDLSSPVAVVFRPTQLRTAGDMYVVEQSGLLRLVRNGRASATPALDLTGNVTDGNEQGFLGAAFSPDGSHLYVNYTDRNGDTNVDEYAMKGANADPNTKRRVFFAEQPYANHNGGDLQFGPDGLLYIGLGDGGSAGDPEGNGQDLSTPLGKMLRIDPKFGTPLTNPFSNREGALEEIWMFGLRNPWRYSFDRATGDLWIGDVGQGAYEEIDYARQGGKGINWGWGEREGFHAFNGGARPAGARDPIIETSHDDGNCAIVGGYVYRGKAVPALTGIYLYGDNCRSNIAGLVERNGRAIAHQDIGLDVPALTSFGEDGAGELYVAARDGTVSRIVAG